MPTLVYMTYCQRTIFFNQPTFLAILCIFSTFRFISIRRENTARKIVGKPRNMKAVFNYTTAVSYYYNNTVFRANLEFIYSNVVRFITYLNGVAVVVGAVLSRPRPSLYNNVIRFPFLIIQYNDIILWCNDWERIYKEDVYNY